MTNLLVILLISKNKIVMRFFKCTKKKLHIYLYNMIDLIKKKQFV